MQAGRHPLDESAGPRLPTATVIREYLPITTDGQILAVFAVWRDATPILTQLDEARRGVVIVTLSAAAIAAALLYLIFRAAQRRITRQTAQLLEAERRDPLTSLLNHGALVAALTSSIETARRDGGAIGVALIDIDNFRLLNETYGHMAGDRALLDVGVLVVGNLPEGAVCGRYGPDEFLILADAGIVHEIEPSIERMRAALADLSLQFEASERLPITVSGGIATFPEHADSATDLLSVVATTLAEAKASGGDAVRVASIEPRERGSSGFDVLQGLVRAVDTKDRYTKRHSEDVSRYGLFIADLLDLDDATRDAIRVAGLLHDVGKIGIPDEILRKPGKLTAEEYGIVKQHVALGDLIVRDLPDIDAIRAGIRHHHERWDGAGYLTGLAGEEIPLIARILSVGDAFSAMTTTRPYRKALSIQEALKRLGDAAGSQLDEAGTGPTTVVFGTGSGGDRLEGIEERCLRRQCSRPFDHVTERVDGNGNITTRHPCQFPQGPPLLPLIPFVITSGGAPTPTPTPTQTPTPTLRRPHPPLRRRPRPRQPRHRRERPRRLHARLPPPPRPRILRPHPGRRFPLEKEAPR